MELMRKVFPAPFGLTLLWVIVTCYVWGTVFGHLGVEVWAGAMFGFAWAWASYEVIHLIWGRRGS